MRANRPVAPRARLGAQTPRKARASTTAFPAGIRRDIALGRPTSSPRGDRRSARRRRAGPEEKTRPWAEDGPGFPPAPPGHGEAAERRSAASPHFFRPQRPASFPRSARRRRFHSRAVCGAPPGRPPHRSPVGGNLAPRRIGVGQVLACRAERSAPIRWKGRETPRPQAQKRFFFRRLCGFPQPRGTSGWLRAIFC